MTERYNTFLTWMGMFFFMFIFIVFVLFISFVHSDTQYYCFITELVSSACFTFMCL